MEYECPRCHYKTNRKSSYVDHLNRQNPCLKTFSDKTISEILEEVLRDKEFKCTECSKSFSHYSSLSRHKKEHGSSVTVDTTQNIDIQTTDNHIHTHSHNQANDNTHHSHNTTTTTTNSHNVSQTINVQNLNITILPFGQERTDHVEENADFMKRTLGNVDSTGVADMVKAIFFNKEVPENRNCHIKREHKPGKMLVYMKENGADDPDWVEQDLEFTLDKMIDKGMRLLIKHNGHIFTIQHENGDELAGERFDRNNASLSDIGKKSRNIYPKIKSSIVSAAKTCKQQEKKQ